MTSLASVLVAPADAVVHRLAPTTTPAAVERAALSAGWRFAVVESDGVATTADALDAFRRGLGRPDGLGGDLDALADALGDVGDDQSPGTVLLWDRPTRFETAAADDYRAVLDLLARRAGDESRPRVVALVRPAPVAS